MLGQRNKSMPDFLNMLIWQIRPTTITYLTRDRAILESWAQFKICHCTIKACSWLNYTPIQYSSLTTIWSRCNAFWKLPDLEEPARPPLPSRPLGHLSNWHWGAGIYQRELLGPGIFGRHPRGLPEGKYYIGLPTRLCSTSERTFEKAWWESREWADSW